MADEVGSASVRIDPTLDAFEDELKTRLDEIVAGVSENAAIGVSVDDTAAKAELDDIDAKADATGQKRETITVSTDTDTAKDAVDDLARSLDNTDDKSGNLRRDFEDLVAGLDGGQGTFETIRGASEAVSSAWESVGGAADTISEGLTTLGTAATSVGTGAADAATGVEQLGTSASGAGGGVSSLLSSLGEIDLEGGPAGAALTALEVVLATALIPILATGTGALIGFAGALTAAGAGLGAFGLAAAGDLKTFESEAKGILTAWQQDMAGAVQPVVNSLKTIVAQGLAAISPLVTAGAAGLKSAISTISADLQSAGFERFITFLATNAPAAISTFATVLSNFGGGFADMLEASQPLITMVEHGLVSLSTDFEKFASSNAFQQFVAYAVANAPEVSHFFEQLITDGAELFTALEPLGSVVLRVVNVMLDSLPEVIPVLALVAKAVTETVGPALKAYQEFEHLKDGADDLLGDVVGLVPGLGGVADGLKKSGDSASKASDGFHSISGSMLLAQASANSANGALGLTQAQLQQVEQYTGQAGAATTTFVKTMKTSASQAGITATALVQLSLAAKVSASTIATAISTAQSTTASAWQNFGSLVSKFGATTAAVSQTAIATFLTSTTQAYGQFNTNINTLIGQGYPAKFVAQIEQAGPQAASLLGALVGTTTGKLKDLVTIATKAETAAATSAVQYARLTEIAVQDKAGTIANAIPAAFAAAQAKSAIAATGNATAAVQALDAQYPNWEAAVQPFGLGLPQSMYSAQAQITAAATGQASTATSALGSKSKTFLTAGGDAIGSFVSGMVAKTKTLLAAGKGAGDSAKTGTESSKADMQKAGQDLITGSITGIKAKQGTLNAAALSAVKAAIAATGPKTGGQSVGHDLDDGISTGISSNAAEITTALLGAVKGAISSAGSQAGGQSIGSDLVNGIVAGIDANANKASAAAASAASGAVTAAKGPQGINAGSPSRKAADTVGLPFVQGVAAGIEGNLGLITSAALHAASAAVQGASVTPSGLSAVASPLGVAYGSLTGSNTTPTTFSPTAYIQVTVPPGTTRTAAEQMAAIAAAKVTESMSGLAQFIGANK